MGACFVLFGQTLACCAAMSRFFCHVARTGVVAHRLRLDMGGARPAARAPLAPGAPFTVAWAFLWVTILRVSVFRALLPTVSGFCSYFARARLRPVPASPGASSPVRPRTHLAIYWAVPPELSFACFVILSSPVALFTPIFRFLSNVTRARLRSFATSDGAMCPLRPIAHFAVVWALLRAAILRVRVVAVGVFFVTFRARNAAVLGLLRYGALAGLRPSPAGDWARAPFGPLPLAVNWALVLPTFHCILEFFIALFATVLRFLGDLASSCGLPWNIAARLAAPTPLRPWTHFTVVWALLRVAIFWPLLQRIRARYAAVFRLSLNDPFAKRAPTTARRRAISPMHPVRYHAIHGAWKRWLAHLFIRALPLLLALFVGVFRFTGAGP